jgi:hypothetical protein
MQLTPIVTAAGLFMSLAPTSAAAQVDADSAARREAMVRVSFLAGDWFGSAWYQRPGGARDTLWQTEHVRLKLRGQIVLIEGVGRRMAAGVPGDTVFNALATIDWAPDRGYRMHSSTLDGREGTFPLTVSDDGFAWGFDVPGGKTRFRMRLTADGDWLERGEFTRDGEHWVTTFEMRLRRGSAGPGG